MSKFIKRLFFLFLILIIAFGIWGFNNGMTIDNYQEFIAELMPQSQADKPLPVPIDEEDDEAEPSLTDKVEHNNNPQWEDGEEYALQELPRNPFAKIDEHARNVPASFERNVASLVSYLRLEARTDLEKARAIYIWITDNIRYDDEAFNSRDYPVYTAEYVLKNRAAICDGYSTLYFTLGYKMGLDINKVVGYSKGYGYQAAKGLTESDFHAWNIINIKGKWRIFDATWGRGFGENVNGKLVSTKKFNDYWFDVDPYEAIFSHYPEDSELTFVTPSISLRQYEQMPEIRPEYFDLGFDEKETFLEVVKNPNFKPTTAYDLKTYVKVINAPGAATLDVNQVHEFELFVPRAFKVTAIDSKNKWTFFQRTNGNFKLSLTTKELGELKIVVQLEKNGRTYETIMMYEVVKGKEPG